MSNAWLAAQVDPGQKVTDACVTSPDSKYRGAENQLYRVEIHTGGSAGKATFKWSRDNGSVVTAWLGTSGTNLQVEHARGFEAGDWVELSDDTNELQGLPGTLVKLTKVEGDMLSADPAAVLPPWNQLINPKVRRWNQTANEKTTLDGGAVKITESTFHDDSIDKDAWINLEDGVQIQFQNKGEYRTGDYWLIPARVATGQVEWPVIDGVADFMPPDGIEHHYAPLGFVNWEETNFKSVPCRCVFEPLSSCFRLGSGAVGAHLLRPLFFEERLIAQEEDATAKRKVRRKPKT